MRTIIALLALAFMCVSAPAYAGKAEDEAQIRGWIAHKDKIIVLTREWRTNACSKLVKTTKDSCEGIYDVIIQRRLAERATLELWIKALQLDLEPKDRSLILQKVVPRTEYDRLVKETSDIADFAEILYPQPKKSAAK